MKTKQKAIELQEKANQLLQMAQDMDKRVERYRENEIRMKRSMFPELSQTYKLNAETSKRASNRLWQAYLNVLTEIKLEL